MLSSQFYNFQLESSKINSTSSIFQKLPYNQVNVKGNNCFYCFLAYPSDCSNNIVEKLNKFLSNIDEEKQSESIILQFNPKLKLNVFIKDPKPFAYIDYYSDTGTEFRVNIEEISSALSIFFDYNEFVLSSEKSNKFILSALRYELVNTNSKIIKQSESFIQYSQENRTFRLTKEMKITVKVVDVYMIILVEFSKFKASEDTESIRQSLENLNSKLQNGRFYFDSELKFEYKENLLLKLDINPRIIIKVKRILAQLYNYMPFLELSLSKPNLTTILQSNLDLAHSSKSSNLIQNQINQNGYKKKIQILKKIEKNPYLRRRLNIKFINKCEPFIEIEKFYMNDSNLYEMLQVENIDVVDLILEFLKELKKAGLHLKNSNFPLEFFVWVDEKIVFNHKTSLITILEVKDDGEVKDDEEVNRQNTQKIPNSTVVGPKVIQMRNSIDQEEPKTNKSLKTQPISHSRSFYIVGYGNCEISEEDYMMVEYHFNLLNNIVELKNVKDRLLVFKVSFEESSMLAKIFLEKSEIETRLYLWNQCCGKEIIQYFGWDMNTQGSFLISENYTNFSSKIQEIFRNTSNLLDFISNVLRMINSLHLRRANFCCFDMDSLVFDQESNLKFLVKSTSEISSFFQSDEVQQDRPSSKSLLFSFGRFLQLITLGYLERHTDWNILAKKTFPESFKRENPKFLEIIKKCTKSSLILRASLNEISLPKNLLIC